MTAADMAVWADKLRRKYGILWPISLTSDDTEDDQPQQMERITYGH